MLIAASMSWACRSRTTSKLSWADESPRDMENAAQVRAAFFYLRIGFGKGGHFRKIHALTETNHNCAHRVLIFTQN